jgi:hypothetical protein
VIAAEEDTVIDKRAVEETDNEDISPDTMEDARVGMPPAPLIAGSAR